MSPATLLLLVLKSSFEPIGMPGAYSRAENRVLLSVA